MALSPVELFEHAKSGNVTFFLDSGMDPVRLGRYSFIGWDPFLVVKSKGQHIECTDWRGTSIHCGNPFTLLERLLEQYTLPAEESPVPLVGGAVGYLSYDLCHFIERLPSRAYDDLLLPDLSMGFYDCAVAFDHLLGKAYLVSTGLPAEDPWSQKERAQTRLEHLLRQIEVPMRHRDWRPSAHTPETGPAPMGSGPQSNFQREEYLRTIEKAKRYIYEGEIYQVNLSQRFEAALQCPPFQLYKQLRAINPAPFACYLEFPECTIVSSSPERFLRLAGDALETRPIKGTRPRGRSPAEDEALAKELVNSQKDQAEHIMIVDLERNDLGRVCRFGTVQVQEFMALEAYASVFHLTSTVIGRLRSDRTRIDALKACFPGGSITGAPKIRAMEVIDELEPTRRSIYTGSMGYFSFDGSMDLNIAIRTIITKGSKAYLQVGGGIVYDSDPEKEYQETLDKAYALFAALESTAPQVVTPPP